MCVMAGRLDGIPEGFPEEVVVGPGSAGVWGLPREEHSASCTCKGPEGGTAAGLEEWKGQGGCREANGGQMAPGLDYSRLG